MVKILNDEIYNLWNCIKTRFFLKQINPVNLKRSLVPVPETQYLRSAGVNKI